MSAEAPLPEPVPPPLPRHVGAPAPRRERWWLHGVLFLLTAGMTTVAGIGFWLGYERHSVPIPETLSAFLAHWPHGLLFSGPFLLILFSHEMGHYVTARLYRIDVSPPFFLPMPPLLPIAPGSMGAFIRIREPLRSKKQLFDVGIGGPIAGFLVALPFLAWGIVATRPNFEALTDSTWVWHYPLGVTLLQKLLLGRTFDSLHVVEHPAFVAGWWGLFLTAFNLIPLGQLDGGHVAYATFGRRHRPLAYVTFGVLVGLGAAYNGWWVLAVAVLLLMGLRHPPVDDEDAPLDPRRRLLAAGALFMLVVSFTPVPFSLVEPSPRRRSPDEGRGTVVRQLDLHRGPEDAGRDRESRSPKRRDEAREERLGDVRLRGSFEAGPPPA